MRSRPTRPLCPDSFALCRHISVNGGPVNEAYVNPGSNQAEVILQVLDYRSGAIRRRLKRTCRQSEAVAENAGRQPPTVAAPRAQHVEGKQRDIHQPGSQGGARVGHQVAALHGTGSRFERGRHLGNEVRRHTGVGVYHQKGVCAFGDQTSECEFQGVPFTALRRWLRSMTRAPALRATAAVWSLQLSAITTTSAVRAAVARRRF